MVKSRLNVVHTDSVDLNKTSSISAMPEYRDAPLAVTYTQALHQSSVTQTGRAVAQRVRGVGETRLAAGLVAVGEVSSSEFHLILASLQWPISFHSSPGDTYSTPMIWKRSPVLESTKSLPFTSRVLTAAAEPIRAQAAVKRRP